MTHTTLSRIFITVIFIMVSFSILAAGHTAKTESEPANKEMKAVAVIDYSEPGNKMPVSADTHSNQSPAKAHAPQLEELPHIHKFHKERVKKIRKHHGKYWLLSQVLIVICHLSILLIAYLHATH
jgi:hypothetical protein